MGATRRVLSLSEQAKQWKSRNKGVNQDRGRLKFLYTEVTKSMHCDALDRMRNERLLLFLEQRPSFPSRFVHRTSLPSLSVDRVPAP